MICKFFAEFLQKLLIFQTGFLRNFWDCSGAKGCKSCRSWKMLSNAYFLAKFRFDTAENEPAKNLQNFRKMHFRKMHFRKMHFRKSHFRKMRAAGTRSIEASSSSRLLPRSKAPRSAPAVRFRIDGWANFRIWNLRPDGPWGKLWTSR